MAIRFAMRGIFAGLFVAAVALDCAAANPVKEGAKGGRAAAAADDAETKPDADSTTPDGPTESRDETVLRNKLEKTLAKGKGDIYVLGVSETTFHIEVERKGYRNHNQNGQLLREEITEFKTGGEYYPVPTVQFQAVTGEDAAVAFVMDHMKKYPPVPKKKTRKKDKQADAGPPPPVGDWTFVGRYSDQTKAEAALKQAQEKFDALPNWKASEKKGGD